MNITHLKDLPTLIWLVMPTTKGRLSSIKSFLQKLQQMKLKGRESKHKVDTKVLLNLQWLKNKTLSDSIQLLLILQISSNLVIKISVNKSQQPNLFQTLSTKRFARTLQGEWSQTKLKRMWFIAIWLHQITHLTRARSLLFFLGISLKSINKTTFRQLCWKKGRS